MTVLVICGESTYPGSAQFRSLLTKERRNGAEYTVCIDSGHGGNDPGKIGVAGTKEKRSQSDDRTEVEEAP